MRLLSISIIALLSLAGSACTVSINTGPELAEQPLTDIVDHKYASNGDVKIHYAALGSGPLVVMIHGFPDYWYSWRAQMRVLSEEYRVVAMDNRGYNLSDAPDGVDAYQMPNLVADVAAVIKAEGARNAIVVGHDWGGAIAWNVAMFRPELVSNLVILNLPHPNGLARELANNPEQRANSGYAFQFQQPGAHKALTAQGLARWVSDAEAQQKYIEAFERSSFEGMLNYYKANFPRPDQPAAEALSGTPTPLPKVKAPVLIIHGLEDTALLPGGHDGTWQWVEQDATLVTVPGAGHFVQQDASRFVSDTISAWLSTRRGS